MNSRSYTPTTSIAIHPPYSLHLLLSLPNELLHSIVEYIAYTYEPDRFPVKQPSPELSALSVANWQLRRLCLPFLFAEVVIHIEEEVQQLKHEFAHLLKFTKILAILDIPHSGDEALSQIIPQFEQLSDVELQLSGRNGDGINLFRTILAHPTVTSLEVDALPDEYMWNANDDLSKVILDWTTLSHTLSPHFGNCLARGMRIRTLQLDKDESHGPRIGSKILSGLQEIHIFDYDKADSLSWLPSLSLTHPTLNELWLFDRHSHNIYIRDDVALPSFLPIEESQRQDLAKSIVIKKIGLRRAVGPFPPEWYVTALCFTVNAVGVSLIKTLESVALSFPKLETITLELARHVGMYDIDDVVSAFARFSSLRVVEPNNIFRRLKLGPEFDTLMPPVLSTRDVPEACAESVLLAFASRLAKQVRTLDLIHIDDCKYYHPTNTTPPWHITGWLHVLNSNRDIGGSFD
ncbi:hypothetical protein FB446DRAFT_231119 [Lentinula raphanica]|nr:hypothetical protein FB446DRAFT_231119 [Lentinula raphanica]